MSPQDSAGNQRWKSGHSPARSLDMGKNSQTSPLLFQYTRALHLAGWHHRWACKSNNGNSDMKRWPEWTQGLLPSQRHIKTTTQATVTHQAQGSRPGPRCEAGLGPWRKRTWTWHPGWLVTELLCCFGQFLYILIVTVSLQNRSNDKDLHRLIMRGRWKANGVSLLIISIPIFLIHSMVTDLTLQPI